MNRVWRGDDGTDSLANGYNIGKRGGGHGETKRTQIKQESFVGICLRLSGRKTDKRKSDEAKGFYF